jgi:hypothetical protein
VHSYRSDAGIIAAVMLSTSALAIADAAAVKPGIPSPS